MIIVEMRLFKLQVQNLETDHNLIRVEIPVGASQLIQKLKEYNIDFDAHPIPQKSIFVTIASNLILPLIFIGGLILFLPKLQITFHQIQVHHQ
jgi:ATP-dependent Zn protease